jgi:hypothetical protein
MNRYRFGNGSVFELKGAVVGDYGDHMVFLFPYESEARTFDQVATASESLVSSNLYSEIVADEMGFTGRDRDGQFLLLRPVGRYAVVCVDKDRADAFTALEEVAARLAFSEGRAR